MRVPDIYKHPKRTGPMVNTYAIESRNTPRFFDDVSLGNPDPFLDYLPENRRIGANPYGLWLGYRIGDLRGLGWVRTKKKPHE